VTCACGHGWEYHGPEVPGCVECRCRTLHRLDVVSGPVTRVEWRAVFSYPSSYLGPTSDSYGPPRNTRKEAESDRVPRAEETRGWRSGVQTRTVTEWEAAS
jgi:hypothetical protein